MVFKRQSTRRDPVFSLKTTHILKIGDDLHSRVRRHACTHTHTHRHNTHEHTHTHTQIKHARTHPLLKHYTRSLSRTHTYTHTNTHTHTHTHMCSLLCDHCEGLSSVLPSRSELWGHTDTQTNIPISTHTHTHTHSCWHEHLTKPSFGEKERKSVTPSSTSSSGSRNCAQRHLEVVSISKVNALPSSGQQPACHTHKHGCKRASSSK